VNERLRQVAAQPAPGIESLFFDGMPGPAGGFLTPELTSPGLGVAFRAPGAARYRTA
jgi:hypothetical protein